MNNQQLVVGMYRFLEAQGVKNLVERTRAAARAAGGTFSNAESSVWLKAFVSSHGRKTDGKTDAVRTENGKFAGRKSKHVSDGKQEETRTDDGRKDGRETDSRANKEPLVTNPPIETNVSICPPKGVTRPIAPEVAFEEQDERRVQQSLVLVAAENKTGVLTAARIRTLRAEMRTAFDEFGADRWRYGLDEAAPRGKPWAYALAVMRKNENVPTYAPNVLPLRGPPNGRRPGYVDRPIDPDRMAGIERVAASSRAIWDETPSDGLKNPA